MPRRKQARRANVKDLRSILRLSYEQGLSVRAISERLQLSKTTVSTYLLRAREVGISSWPLPPGQDDDAGLAQLLSRNLRNTHTTALGIVQQAAKEHKLGASRP